MAILTLNEILRNDIIESLQGSENILVKTITDLTPKVKPGSDRVTIPKVAGLALSDVKSDGTDAVAGGMTTTGTALLLDQCKEVPEYILYKNGIQSAIDLEAAFIDNSPAVYAQGIETGIATKLATASSLDFDSASAVAGMFTVADFSKAKKKLDTARVPKKDRYAAVNAEGMEILSNMQEFQDGSKSLSAEALRLGVVSQVKGFWIVQSEDVPGTGATLKVLFYHKSAVAFALQDGVEYITEEHKSKGRKFIALRGLYGLIDVDNASGAGVRKITMSCTTATA